jgi:hypothetical protein
LFTFELVKSQTWRIHVFDTASLIEQSQNEIKPSFVLSLNANFAACGEKSDKPLCENEWIINYL